MKDTDPTAFFWKVAEPMLREQAISKGKIMGIPCLRCEGEFLAAADHRTGDLIVKLPAARVARLIDERKGAEFAPAGRRFNEWAVVAKRDARFWKRLLNEAKEFVGSNGKG